MSFRKMQIRTALRRLNRKIRKAYGGDHPLHIAATMLTDSLDSIKKKAHVMPRGRPIKTNRDYDGEWDPDGVDDEELSDEEFEALKASVTTQLRKALSEWQLGDFSSEPEPEQEKDMRLEAFAPTDRNIAYWSQYRKLGLSEQAVNDFLEYIGGIK